MSKSLDRKLHDKVVSLIRPGFVFICLLNITGALVLGLSGLSSLRAEWAFSIGIDAVSLIACAILYYSIMRDSEQVDDHNIIFAILLFVNAIGLFLDEAAWAIEGNASLVVLNRVINAVLFANNCTLIYVFWEYVSYAIGADRKVQLSSRTGITVIYLISVLMSLSNIFYPLFFSIDSSGTYHRGSLYVLSYIFMIAVIPPFIVRLFRSEAKRREKIIVSSFFVLPIISQIITTAYFGITAQQAASFVAILLIYGVLVADRGKKLESTRTELDMAAQIQTAMMPNIFPAFPERRELDIYATMEPARVVGGDFYDFFLIDDDHLYMAMADVSGKGIPASLFMMISKIILQNTAMLGKSPAEILSYTNDLICSNNPMEMFVTVWVGILELSTGKLTAASAGHEYPALKDSSGQFRLIRDRHGIVLGAMEGMSYTEHETILKPGSRLFLYTDGIPEATNETDEMFGSERMIEALNLEPTATPQEILQNVRDSVNDFVKSAEQFDDMTMMCIEYKGIQEK